MTPDNQDKIDSNPMGEGFSLFVLSLVVGSMIVAPALMAAGSFNAWYKALTAVAK